MEICNPDVSAVGYDGRQFEAVPGSMGHVFDVPTECGEHLLRTPGWRWPEPGDWQPADPVPVEDVPPFPDMGSPYVQEPPDDELPPADPPADVPGPSNADIRAWAVAAGLTVSARGAIPAAVRDAYTAAHQQ